MNYADLFNLALKYAWTIPLFPFISFLIISLVTIKSRVSYWVSLTGIFCSLVVSLGVIGSRIISPASPYQVSFDWISLSGFNIPVGILIDNLSAMMLVVVSLVAFLIQIYSSGYMEHEGDASFSRYFAYMSLFACSMLGLVVANNFLQTYIFWELVGLCSYLLIGFWYKKKSAADAAKKAFIVTRFGDLGLLIGIIYLSINTGTFNFLQIEAMVPALKIGFLTITALLIFCGAVGKSAQFPLHIWLPDAMEGPTPVSALIHAATMVAAGVYLVARCYPIFNESHLALLVVACIGAITAFLGATIAIVQNDIKRVLAYSTISQLGYMMLALGVGAYTAATFHLMNHAFFKALLFLTAGSVIHKLHTNNIWEMGGLGKKMKVTALTFLIGTLALAGIPPFSGFWSKDEIIVAVSKVSFTPYFSAQYHNIILIISWFLKLVAFGVVLLTAFYMFRLYYIVFCGTYRGKLQPSENRLVITVPLVVLSLFAIGSGWAGTPFNNLYEKFIHLGHLHLKSVSGLVNMNMIISLGLVVLGILLAYVIYFKKAVTEESLQKRFSLIYLCLEKKYWMDEIWTMLVKLFVFIPAKIFAWIDEYIIDGIVKGTGWITLQLGTAVKKEHTGKVQSYVWFFLFGVLFLIFGLFLFQRYLFDFGIFWWR